MRGVIAISVNPIKLANEALQISAHEYPGLEVEQYLSELESIARTIRARLPDNPSTSETIRAINHHLYDELGYAGNAGEFYDPRNSFLSDVMDRRLGLPITLALLYMVVAHYLGLEVEGVSFPGHFLLKYEDAGDKVVLDPFGGAVLDARALNDRLQHIYGGDAPTVERAPSLLEAARHDDILIRMLRNLKVIYLQREDYLRSLWVTDRIIRVSPDIPSEWRDRGGLYQRLECLHQAQADYRHYLKLAPEAEDAPRVHATVVELQSQAGSLH